MDRYLLHYLPLRNLTSKNRGFLIHVNKEDIQAHASEETILQTVAESKDPVAFTHGGFRHFVDIPLVVEI